LDYQLDAVAGRLSVGPCLMGGDYGAGGVPLMVESPWPSSAGAAPPPPARAARPRSGGAEGSGPRQVRQRPRVAGAEAAWPAGPALTLTRASSDGSLCGELSPSGVEAAAHGAARAAAEAGAAAAAATGGGGRDDLPVDCPPMISNPFFWFG
jgi:hypothetical protein